MLTFMLQQLERLLPAIPTPAPASGIKSVLVVDLNFLGDMLFSSPVYRALHQQLPGARVESLVYEFCRPALAANPYVDRIHTVRRAGLGAQLVAALRMRRQRYDLILQLNTSLRVNLLIWLMRGRYRLGYNYAHRGAPCNIRVEIPFRTARRGNRVDECLGLLEQAFGWTVAERGMIFRPRAEALARADAFLHAQGVRPGELLIAMHANSRQDWTARRWPADRFAALAGRLIREKQARIVLTGSAGDLPYLETLAGMIDVPGQVVMAAGALSLSETAALLQRVMLFITINTGPMHLAVAQDTPTVAIIGGTPAEVVYPRGNPRFLFVDDPSLEAWDPASGKSAIEPALAQISVDQVYAQVLALLHTLKNP
ncbi:MAG TPA: glycosyltransferase family 9 protein [Bacteroidota bacterium]